MKTKWVLGVLLAGGMAVAATAPVAMRVELEPLRPVGANTEVAVIIQIAPMDRSRIGSNAIFRIELDEGRVSSGSPMRAVQAGDDGSFRVVVEWPPGEHDLRVTIEDPNREDTGLWVGKVRIPDMSRGATYQETDEPEPVPVPEPEPEMTEPTTTEPETAVEETTSEALAAAVSATAAAAVIPEPPTPPVEPEIAPEPEPVPVPEMTEPTTTEPETAVEETTSEALAAAVSATAAAAMTPEPPTPPVEPEIAPEPEPVPEPEMTEPALVEPLRADPAPSAAKPEVVEPSEPAEQAPALAPVSADLTARYAEWERADPEIREFSVIAMRGRDPAQDLDAGDLRLRVGGSEMPVEKLGDSDSAPLLLGLAIDVVPDDVDGWSGTQGSLAPIVERAGGGRGKIFVANPRGVGDWEAEPGSPDRGVGSQTTVNVAQSVVASLERFEGQRGRSFLVVLTDGRSEPTKDEWQQATDAAGGAGVPILVVALWDEEFSQRTRKNLKKLTVVSGGSLFLVQGRNQLESAADRFGRYLDGGYAVRFRMPSVEQGGCPRQTAKSPSAPRRAFGDSVILKAPETLSS
jgi:hypothetical protein